MTLGYKLEPAEAVFFCTTVFMKVYFNGTLSVISLHTSIRQCVLFVKIFNSKTRNAKYESTPCTPASGGHAPPFGGVKAQGALIGSGAADILPLRRG